MDQALALAVGTLTSPMVLFFLVGLVVVRGFAMAGLPAGGTALRATFPCTLLPGLPLTLRAAERISPVTAV